MLNYTIMRLDEEHLEDICKDIVYQIENGIATMPLFCMTLTPEGIPAIDKAELLCSVYEKFKAKLDAMNVPSGILIQASIGHGWKLDAPSAFQKYVGLADGSIPEVCCPIDDGFRTYIRKAAKRIASSHPAHIMLDDDFRLMYRPQKGCACPLHMNRFNQLANTNLTREELYQAMCQEDEVGKSYKKLFIKTQIDSLLECAREIRAGIDEVDSSIPGSYCSCGISAEGAYEITTIMAGENNPIIVRFNNANYCALDRRKFTHIMYRAATQITALSGTPDVFLAETDTCPQNRYSTSAAMMHSHFTFTILEGAKGAKHWLTRLGTYEPASGKAYREKLKKYRGFYQTLADLNDKLTWLGCKIPMPSGPFYQLIPHDNEAHGLGWYSHVLDRMGLPLHFSNRGEGAVFFAGKYDKKFTDNELKSFLAGNVVLDGVAAESFIERGFGKYIGVDVKCRTSTDKNVSGELLYPNGISDGQFDIREIIPKADNVKRYADAYHLRDGVYKDVLFPSVTSYKNELGGTVVVFAGNSVFSYDLTTAYGWLNESRKKQLVDILTDLSVLPVYYPEDVELLLKAAKIDDGSLFCAILNIGLDQIEELPLVIHQDVNKIQRLLPDGTYQSVPFVREGDLYTLSVPANVFDPLILIIK